MQQIEVIYKIHTPASVGYKNTAYFTDWYDFADWLKQTNLSGNAVLVIEWKYV